jgi:hypothetical protein
METLHKNLSINPIDTYSWLQRPAHLRTMSEQNAGPISIEWVADLRPPAHVRVLANPSRTYPLYLVKKS